MDVMMERRQGRDTFGPGKLCQAMGITKSENNVDLTEAGSPLRIEAGIFVPDSSVTIGARVGLNSTPEPWLSKPWRFLVKNCENREWIIEIHSLSRRSYGFT
jgi:3-methyladenine DNA glycosylase Mpg